MASDKGKARCADVWAGRLYNRRFWWAYYAGAGYLDPIGSLDWRLACAWWWSGQGGAGGRADVLAWIELVRGVKL